MTKAKDESYFTLDKYECYWEDAYMEIDWKNIDEAKLDTPLDHPYLLHLS